MQQPETIAHIAVAQGLPKIQHLTRRQPELGLVAAAVLPFAGAQRCQPHAHAESRLYAQRFGFLHHQRQLGRLFHHDERLHAELAPNQREANVFTIFVTVADDQPTGPRQRQHRHQFGLAAGFQTEALARVRRQRACHRRMLIDLDRIHRGITANVIVFPLRLRERRLQLTQTIAENLRKPHQQRQFRAAGLRRIHDLGQRRTGCLRTVWVDHDAALRIDIEITFGPVRDRIRLAGVVDGPGGHGHASGDAVGTRIVGRVSTRRSASQPVQFPRRNTGSTHTERTCRASALWSLSVNTLTLPGRRSAATIRFSPGASLATEPRHVTSSA